MREINTSDKRFHNGNGRNEMGTVVTAEWLNAVQDELVGVIKGLGGQVDPFRPNQIYQLLAAEFGKKAGGVHTHTISQVTGLSEALQGLSTSKAPLAHRHEISEINGLSAKLNEIDGKQAALVRHEINLSALNHNKYYLVVFEPNSALLDGRRWRFNVYRHMRGNHKPSWATHDSGFALQLGWESNAAVWGENHVYRVIDNYEYTWTEQPPVINIEQMQEASVEYCYLRGGTSYQVEAMAGFSVQLKSQGFTRHGATLNGVMDFAQNLVPQVTLKKAVETATTLRDISHDLTDFGNLCLDPTMLNPKFGYTWTSGSSERINGKDIRVISARDNFYHRAIKVKAGERFYVSCLYSRKQGTANLGIGLHLDRGKPSVSFIQANSTAPNGVGYRLIAINTVSDVVFERLEGYVDIPAGVSSAELWLQVNQPHGVHTTQYYVTDIEWRRVPGKLVAQSDFSYQRVGDFEVRKYPDGTMIQTYHREENDLREWTQKEFAWAVAFAETPAIIPSITTSFGGTHDCGINVLTTSDRTKVYYHYYEHGNYNQGLCRVQFTGIGRWE